jgi:3',5'-cyclic AMP phosphodiesterase CpdA
MMALVSNYLPETYTTATAVVVSAVVYVLYIIVRKVLAYSSAPIRDLPGPKSVHWLTGSHARNVWEPDAQRTQLEWIREYGRVFNYAWFNVSVVSYYQRQN